MSGLYQAVHDAFRVTFREYVEKELVPHADEWEEAEDFPREVYERMGDLGFLGLQYPEKYGGDNDLLAEAVLHEELVRCMCGGVAGSVAAHVGIALPQINRSGTKEQKEKYLGPGIQGKSIGALGVTEPEAGSDVASLKTYAVKDGSDWVINGSKTFITNGVRGDWVVVAAKTDREKGYSGISQFVVDQGTPGFEVSKKLKKLGWKASDTGELAFVDCRVPADALLGELNRGFHQIMANFAWERLIASLGAIGSAQFALEKAIEYAKERQAFGKPIVKFQVIAHQLADMATDLEAARQITYNALRIYMEGDIPIKEVSMAKLYACDMVCRVVDQALQIYGGYGYMEEYPIARMFRDARVLPIGGGTREIMKEIIVKTMGL